MDAVAGLKVEGGGPSLLETVGGSNAIAALQEKFYAGTLPREAAIANVVLIYGMTEEKATQLFPEVGNNSGTPTAIPGSAQ